VTRRNARSFKQAIWLLSLVLTPIASEANSWGVRRDQLFASIDALPQTERSTAILIAYRAVETNSSKLEMETPKKASDAVKILSIEYQLLAGFAERAQWREMSAWFVEGAELYSEIIRGTRKADSGFSALEQRRKQQYARIVSAEHSRLKAAMKGDPSPAMASLAEETANFIGVSARRYVWKEEPQVSQR